MEVNITWQPLELTNEKISISQYTKEEMMSILLPKTRETLENGICCGVDGCF
ncbi:MAG: hypothetical protein IKJ01_02590 [Lachnospiraceae bacterium]|nr:hypothetical protein [Lachnospiraceae bacterium]